MGAELAVAGNMTFEGRAATRRVIGGGLANAGGDLSPVRIAEIVGKRANLEPGWPGNLRIRALGQGEDLIIVSFSLGRLTELTSAELEVARLANTGHSNSLIARERGTSSYTVARQMSNLLLKLCLGARLGLATVPELNAWSHGSVAHRGTPVDSMLTASGTEFELREATRIWREIACGHWANLVGVDADGMRRAVMSRNSARPIDWRRLGRAHRDVLALLAVGFAQKAIAIKLGLAPRTVSSVLASARRCLGFASLADLVRAYCASRDVSDGSAGHSPIQMPR